jgi:hypothetical protein
MNALHIMGRYRGGQHLWYILKSQLHIHNKILKCYLINFLIKDNPFNKDQSKSYFPKRFSTTSLLDVSLEWLYESALYQQNLSNLKQKFGTLKEGKNSICPLTRNLPFILNLIFFLSPN